ncbi:hypothetical protein KCU99_g1260, partial [Aureobasidium melanogenum]
MDAKQDPYTWEGTTGWRQYRMLRPGRGMYYDIKRRLPYYWSDISDAVTYRTFAATVRMYFVNLLPALAFLLDMNRHTDGFFGVNEALFSSALAAIVFSTLAAQPLTIVGITGLISLFNYTIYDIAVKQGIRDLYPEFLAWVAIWAAITHWITSFGNLCDYMRFITDFSSNAFGMYVGIIYMIKGVQELIAQFYESTHTAGFLSIVVALCYWATVYALEMLPHTVVFTPVTRKVLSDYAYPIATIFWTGFVHIPGTIKSADVLTLPITKAFYPSTNRSWLIHFWDLPVKWIFVALPIGILVTLLFYYDHNVSSIGAQARQYPLKKPAGFHWDFALLGVTCFIAGIIGIPMPNGLVPQAPVHTDSLTEYKDKLVISHETEDDEGRPMERRKKVFVAEAVVEQRISHFLMGLAIVGTMTGPLLIVLHTMPRCLFCGVFFVVGWGSIEGNGMTQKLIFLIKEHRFIDPSEPLLQVPRRKIMLFLLFQILGVGFSVAISQTIGAIGFPVIIISLIPLRWSLMPHCFTRRELEIMDALTADSDVVLCSLGGKPVMPEVALERKRRGFTAEEEGDSAHMSDKEKDSSTPGEESPEMRRMLDLERSGRGNGPYTAVEISAEFSQLFSFIGLATIKELKHLTMASIGTFREEVYMAPSRVPSIRSDGQLNQLLFFNSPNVRHLSLNIPKPLANAEFEWPVMSMMPLTTGLESLELAYTFSNERDLAQILRVCPRLCTLKYDLWTTMEKYASPREALVDLGTLEQALSSVKSTLKSLHLHIGKYIWQSGSWINDWDHVTGELDFSDYPKLSTLHVPLRVLNRTRMADVVLTETETLTMTSHLGTKLPEHLTDLWINLDGFDFPAEDAPGTPPMFHEEELVQIVTGFLNDWQANTPLLQNLRLLVYQAPYLVLEQWDPDIISDALIPRGSEAGVDLSVDVVLYRCSPYVSRKGSFMRQLPPYFDQQTIDSHRVSEKGPNGYYE